MSTSYLSVLSVQYGVLCLLPVRWNMVISWLSLLCRTIVSVVSEMEDGDILVIPTV